MFWKNVDTSLLLLIALKDQFNKLKIQDIYNILVNTVPQLNGEGISMLETVFIEPQRRDTYESEDESEEEKDQVVSGLCALFITKLRSSYQEVWLLTLAKVS